MFNVEGSFDLHLTIYVCTANSTNPFSEEGFGQALEGKSFCRAFG